MRKRLETKKMTFYELFFFGAYIFFMLHIATSSLGLGNNASKLFSLASILSAFIAILLSLKRGSIRKILFICIAMLLSAYVTLVLSDNSRIILFVFLALSAKNINREKIVKFDLLFKIALIFFAIISEKIGLVSGSEGFGLNQGRIRNSFGFRHPNFTGNLMLSIYFDILYLVKNHNIKTLFICILFFIIIWFVVDSRAPAIGVLISSLMLLVSKKIASRKTKIRKITTIIIMLIPIIGSILIATLPNSRTLELLNSQLSGRVYLARSFYDHYGVKVFGNHFAQYGAESGKAYLTYLDNSYLYILLRDGLIIFLGLIGYYYAKLKKSFEDSNQTVPVALATNAFVATMELSLFSVNTNLFVALPLVINKKESKK